MGKNLMRMTIVTTLLAFAACGIAWGQEADHAEASLDHAAAVQPETAANKEMSPWSSIAYLGACLGAGLGVIGGGMGIGRIAGSATEGISRQPEAAGQMFLAWLIPAAMVEGMALFAIVICFMITMK